jgi:hypothetical protein
MVDALWRQFTRLHRLAVSPPMRSPARGLRRCSTWWLQDQLRRHTVTKLQGDGEKTLEVASVIFRFVRDFSVLGLGCTVPI